MQKLIIFAAVMACAFAAPVENKDENFGAARLARPSPINPDIPSDPKPEEKVVLISPEKAVEVEDPVIKPLGPYALPTPTRRFLKRENKDQDSSSDESSSDSQEVKKPTTILKPISHANPSTIEVEKPATQSPVDATSASTPASHRKPYSPRIHQHNEHLFKPTTEAASPAVASNDNANTKRDIPVVESSQKAESDAAKAAPKEEVKQEEKQDEDHKPEHTHSAHPATITRPIPVAELFAKKPAAVAASTE